MMKTEELFAVNANCSNGKYNKDSTKVSNVVDKTCNLDNNMQDLYGSRNYGLSGSRPTMISAKYRQKEERRKILKLSMNKLKRIEDPESSLRRSVLINNTVKRLQREAKKEKLQKNQITAFSSTKCFGISNDFIVRQEENMKQDIFSPALSSRTSDQLLDITNLPESKTSPKYSNDCLDCDEAISELTFHGERISKLTRKRTIDETLKEECDVLSQFYLPSTPLVASSLEEEEDEDVNVVDIDTPSSGSPAKKKRCCDPHDTLATSTSCLTAADRLRDNISSSSALPLSPSSTVTSSPPTSSLSSSCSSALHSSLPPPLPSSPLPSSMSSSSSPSILNFHDWSVDESILLQATAQTTMLHPVSVASTSISSSFSCGHSSMLNEIVVYHNLIASLES